VNLSGQKWSIEDDNAIANLRCYPKRWFLQSH
jgi:hypothetical protein